MRGHFLVGAALQAVAPGVPSVRYLVVSTGPEIVVDGKQDVLNPTHVEEAWPPPGAPMNGSSCTGP